MRFDVKEIWEKGQSARFFLSLREKICLPFARKFETGSYQRKVLLGEHIRKNRFGLTKCMTLDY
jgi:hypothetical protein